MRLVDVDIDVNDYVETWDCNCITGGIQTVMAVDDLSYLPTIDAVPVVHGKWEESDEHKGYCTCSVCFGCYIESEWANEQKWMYCPNCGARMDGDER